MKSYLDDVDNKKIIKNSNINNLNINNNNVTEAFSSFGKNNNSTISNAINNDATIDSKNSIMNIDLKYQKKIDDYSKFSFGIGFFRSKG